MSIEEVRAGLNEASSSAIQARYWLSGVLLSGDQRSNSRALSKQLKNIHNTLAGESDKLTDAKIRTDDNERYSFTAQEYADAAYRKTAAALEGAGASTAQRLYASAERFQEAVTNSRYLALGARMEEVLALHGSLVEKLAGIIAEVETCDAAAVVGVRKAELFATAIEQYRNNL